MKTTQYDISKQVVAALRHYNQFDSRVKFVEPTPFQRAFYLCACYTATAADSDCLKFYRLLATAARYMLRNDCGVWHAVAVVSGGRSRCCCAKCKP